MSKFSKEERKILNSVGRDFAKNANRVKVKKANTIEIDHGFKGIMNQLKKLEKKPFVKIGFPVESKKTDDNKQQIIRGPGGEQLAIVESDFATVLDVAIWHEFGTINMPERSFVRKAFDKNVKKYEKLNKKLITRIYSGKMTVEKALDFLGFTIENDIKEFIQGGEVEPDSLRAISEGGKTLLDTAQLINSITFIKVMNP